MGRALRPPQANVQIHGTLGVDGEPLVGVDGNTEKARIGVDELILVPDNRVPQDTSIIQISQTSHIIRAVKLGWIDLSNLVLFEDFGLSLFKELDSDFVSISGLNETLKVTTSGLLRNPA